MRNAAAPDPADIPGSAPWIATTMNVSLGQSRSANRRSREQYGERFLANRGKPNGPDRIRTCNQGIMSLALQVAKPTHGTDLRQSIGPLTESLQEKPEIDVDLARVTAAWPHLAEPIR